MPKSRITLHKNQRRAEQENNLQELERLAEIESLYERVEAKYIPNKEEIAMKAKEIKEANILRGEIVKDGKFKKNEIGKRGKDKVKRKKIEPSIKRYGN